jgi:hypothetical protein
MKMKIKTSFIFFLLAFLSFGATVKSQELTEPSYELEFLKATYEEFPGKETFFNEIVIYFRYAKNPADKTIMSLRYKYKLDENDEEKVVSIQDSKHSINFFGNKHTGEDPHDLYDILKDKFRFRFQSTGDEFIIAFYLRDLTPTYIPTMQFAYGLYEPSNEDVRIEQYFPIVIERL